MTDMTRYQASLDVAAAVAADASRRNHQAQTMARAAEATLLQAQDAVDDMVAALEGFESTINADEEVRIVVVGGPAGSTIFPENIAARGHDRVVFGGRDQQGCRVIVMQHVTQLNIMMKAARVGEEKARRIGFHALSEDAEVDG